MTTLRTTRSGREFGGQRFGGLIWNPDLDLEPTPLKEDLSMFPDVCLTCEKPICLCSPNMEINLSDEDSDEDIEMGPEIIQ